MSEVKVNKLSPRSGTTVTIGDSGDTINIVGTLQNNGAPIPGDISSVVAGTGLSGGGTTGDVTLNIEAAQPTITSTGTLTSFTSTGIDDNATSTAITIDSSEHTHFGSTSSPSAGQGGVSILNYGTIQSSRTATGNLTHNEFYNPNGQVGNIKTSGSDLNINASSSLTFYTNNSEKMRVLSSGSVGIGTSNPAKKFHVYGSGSEIARFEATGGNSFIGLKDADDGTIAYIGADAGKLKFQTSGSGYSDKLLIDTAGNVGIGTSAPTAKLQVTSASSGVTPNASGDELLVEGSANSGITIGSGTSDVGSLFFGDSGDNNRGSVQYLHSSDDMRFMTNGNVEKLRITSDGSVGINTTSPQAKLHILKTDVGALNDANSNTLMLENTNAGISIGSATTGEGHIYFSDSGDADVGAVSYFHTNNFMQFRANAAERMRITSDGELLVGKTSNNSTVVGVTAERLGNIGLTASSRSLIQTNRLDSHGDLITFNKDNTGVGVIGTQNWGIGTTSPGTTLEVVGTGVNGIELGQQSDGNDSSRLFFTNSSNVCAIRSTGGNLKFSTGATINSSSGDDRVTITSAGNVGIATASPAAVLDVRDETNGANFIVGGSGTTNITKIGGGGGDSIAIYSNTSTKVATFSTSGNTFLEGGIYLSGETNAANELSDYEEGTWTPTATFANDTASGQNGQYTKIGNVVTATFNIVFSSTSFGVQISVAGLPFTSHNVSGSQSAGFGRQAYYDGTSTNLSLAVLNNSTQVDLYENATALQNNSDKILGKNLRATVVYRTA